VSFSIQHANSYEINQLWETLKNKNSSRNTIAEAFAAYRDAATPSAIDPEWIKLLRHACSKHPQECFIKQKIKILAKSRLPAPSSSDLKKCYVALIPDHNLNTLVHMAAKMNDIELIKMMIENKQDIQPCNKEGLTPLHIAAQYGQLDIMNLLIDGGADIDCLSKDGATPCHIAAQVGKVDAIRVLCEHGANINYAVPGKQRPIHLAAQFGQEETVALLIQQGACVNASWEAEGLMPLHLVIKCEEVDEDQKLRIVELLVKAGADIEAAANGQYTPFHVACRKGCFKIMNFLVEHGADIEASLGEGGWTFLHVAVSLGHKYLVQKLIELGANKNALLENGQTPLDIALKYRRLEVIELLQ